VGRSRNKIQKLESARDTELEPIIAKRFQTSDQSGAADSRSEDRKAPGETRRAVFRSDRLAGLPGKTISLEGEKAIAVVEAKVGSRVIDPQKYLAKAKEKGEAMWTAVTSLSKSREAAWQKDDRRDLNKRFETSRLSQA
jgi:hypothetical protein